MKRKVGLGRRALYAAIIAALTLGLAAMLPGVAGAASVERTVLINADSVTTDDGITNGGGEPISLEQYAAEQAGFNVTVVSGSAWKTMTAEEFGHYQVLIVGDPDCGTSPLSATESAAVWAPVVMDAAGGGANPGNRTVVGTDPEDHYSAGEGGASPREAGNPSSAGAEHLVQDGIAFAGGVVGATGVYFDTSCADNGHDVEVFNTLKASTASGEWVEAETHPRCESPVVQIATNSVFNSGPTKLTDEDISGWECSSHVSFVSYPSDWTALAITIPVEGEVRPTPVCGSDIEGGEERCGQAYVLVAGRGIVAKAPNLTLEPETHSDAAGGSHTVVAYAHKGTAPIVGIQVSFVVTETNAGVTGTCTTSAGAADPECKTDEAGKVQFTYGDVHGVGNDTIIGSITLETVFEEEGSEIEARAAVAKTVKTTERATANETWTPVAVVVTPKPVTAVLAEKAVKIPAGAAKASRVTGCIASASYLASVHGTQISSVRFVLDGHTLRTVKHGPFAVRIRLKAGARHRLSMHVAFTSASKSKAVTINRTIARCAARPVSKPRFTG